MADGILNRPVCMNAVISAICGAHGNIELPLWWVCAHTALVRTVAGKRMSLHCYPSRSISLNPPYAVSDQDSILNCTWESRKVRREPSLKKLTVTARLGPWPLADTISPSPNSW